MDIIHILFMTGFDILGLLFCFLIDYVTIEKRMNSITGIWAVLLTFTFVGSGIDNMSIDELRVYTLICLCLCFLYSVGIEWAKKKFKTEKGIEDVHQNIWRSQLIQLLIACVISLPSFILFHFLPKTNHTLILIMYLAICGSVLFIVFLHNRTKMKNGQTANNTLIICYYILSILCVVSEIDLAQLPILMFVSWILLFVYYGAIVPTYVSLNK